MRRPARSSTRGAHIVALLLVLTAVSGCLADPKVAPSTEEARQAELLRAMEEAHARLGDPEADIEEALPQEAPPLSQGDFARFEGERRCLGEHFVKDAPAREAAEQRLLATWNVRAEWAAEQRRRLSAEPKKKALVVRIAQQRFEQVCPSGRASIPFLAQLGL